MNSNPNDPIALQLVLGTVHDAAPLALLGKQVFTDTYGAAIPATILQLHLDRHFSAEHLTAELTTPQIRYLIAKVNKSLIGYAKTTEANPPNCAQRASSLELVNLYVDQAYHGRGVGSQLMKQVLIQAKARAYQTMWLCVWKANTTAIDFYKKWGFRRIGTKKVTVDTVIFDDWVMARSLEEIDDD